MAIHQKENTVEKLSEELQACKGFWRSGKRKQLQEQISKVQTEVEPMKAQLTTIVKNAGYKNMKEFLKAYNDAKSEYGDYQEDLEKWERMYGSKKPKRSVRARLAEKQQNIREREERHPSVHRTDRGAR